MARKPLSKKTRFGVFKRDLFVCQYCGKTPPAVVLEVDHIVPVSKGGGNDIDNLLTACFDCNRGKGAGVLSVAPETISAKAEVLAEKQAQMRSYNRLRKQAAKMDEAAIDEVEAVFRRTFGEFGFSDKFRESVRSFINEIGIDGVCWSMSKACSKIRDKDDALKYFCGICWKKIRGEER